MIEIRWHGRGGQGCWTVARLLGTAVTKYENKYALAFPSFGPERRGAPVLGFTKIDDKPIFDRSEVVDCDYVIVLDETLISEGTARGLKKDGRIMINTAYPQKYEGYFKGCNIITFDATSAALKVFGKPIVNTAMLGVLVAVSGIAGLEAIESAIKEDMKKSIQEKNIQIVRTVYQEMRNNVKNKT
jgi:pyruvate ferredoxin oxidoreductase gamma subunit